MKTYVNGEVLIMTEEELAQHETEMRPTAQERIEELKKLLADTDYKTIKYMEGALDEEEFVQSCAQRADWRASINELEQQAQD